LKLDDAADASGVISGLALGDIIDFGAIPSARAKLAGSTLTVTTGTGQTFAFQVAGSLAGNFFLAKSDGSGGSALVLTPDYPLAQASINSGSSINLGAAHVGSVLIQPLSISNSALAPAEALDGGIAGTTGAAVASGAIGLLGAGQTDATDIAAGVTTAAAGPASGTVTLNFSSDGASTDGTGTTALQSQTVTVSGTVYREAVAAIGALPAIVAHVGDSVVQSVSVTNAAAADGYSENLIASAAGTTGSMTAQGATGDIAPGASGAGVTLGVSTATAGAVSGSVTLALTSDGNGIDGLGTTALASQTVTVSGTVYREAVAAIGALPAIVAHVGDTVVQSVLVMNTAAADGYSENLIASVTGTTGGISAQGATGDIAPGASGAGVTFGISTATAGAVSGGVTLALTSDGSGIDGLGTTALASQTVTVNATIENYAVAALQQIAGGGAWSQNGNSYALNMGTFARGGGPVSVGIAVANTAQGPADMLSGMFAASGSSVYSLAGFAPFSGLAAGQSDAQPTVTLDTGTAGTFTETITLNPTSSNASEYAGALAPETLTISGTVLASISWSGPSKTNRSGGWNSASNWTQGLVPTSQTTAVVNATGSYTLTSSQDNIVGAVSIGDAGATLAIAGGKFTIAGVGNSRIPGPSRSPMAAPSRCREP
jgi:hypothetical protein